MSNRVLYQAKELPVLQNTTFKTKDEAVNSRRGSVCLIEDNETGLIRNAEFDPDKLIYDENYQNEQSCSTGFQLHLNSVVSILERHFMQKSAVEIGCGKGFFLELLQSRGWKATGIDPAYEGSNPHVIKARFEPGLGLSADGIVLRHVLEHIQNPIGFLEEIRRSNNGQGLIYIEVPCFDWICENRAWFDVFYEHVNYFRLSDFNRMFGRVLESGRLFGGQYLYVVADLSSLRPISYDAANKVDFPQDFLAGRDRYYKLDNGPRAIWGASSKGVIFAIHMQQLETNVDFAVDVNPVKQGRFLPCSGLRVVSPAEAMATLPDGGEILVMNSNYVEEIKLMSGNRYTYTQIDAQAPH